MNATERHSPCIYRKTCTHTHKRIHSCTLEAIYLLFFIPLPPVISKREDVPNHSIYAQRALSIATRNASGARSLGFSGYTHVCATAVCGSPFHQNIFLFYWWKSAVSVSNCFSWILRIRAKIIPHADVVLYSTHKGLL